MIAALRVVAMRGLLDIPSVVALSTCSKLLRHSCWHFAHMLPGAKEAALRLLTNVLFMPTIRMTTPADAPDVQRPVCVRTYTCPVFLTKTGGLDARHWFYALHRPQNTRVFVDSAGRSPCVFFQPRGLYETPFSAWNAAHESEGWICSCPSHYPALLPGSLLVREAASSVLEEGTFTAKPQFTTWLTVSHALMLLGEYAPDASHRTSRAAVTARATLQQAQSLQDKLTRVRHPRARGSALLDLAAVAAGMVRDTDDWAGVVAVMQSRLDFAAAAAAVRPPVTVYNTKECTAMRFCVAVFTAQLELALGRPVTAEDLHADTAPCCQGKMSDSTLPAAHHDPRWPMRALGSWISVARMVKQARQPSGALFRDENAAHGAGVHPRATASVSGCAAMRSTAISAARYALYAERVSAAVQQAAAAEHARKVDKYQTLLYAPQLQYLLYVNTFYRAARVREDLSRIDGTHERTARTERLMALFNDSKLTTSLMQRCKQVQLLPRAECRPLPRVLTERLSSSFVSAGQIPCAGDESAAHSSSGSNSDSDSGFYHWLL